MGRTNATILAIGLLACVAMAVMMQHLVGVADRHRPPDAVAAELDRVLGSRVSAPSAYADSRLGGQPVAFVTLRPATGVEPRQLAADAGAHIWRRRDGLVAVVVDCACPGGSTLRYQVPSPSDPAAVPMLIESSSSATRPPATTAETPPAGPR